VSATGLVTLIARRSIADDPSAEHIGSCINATLRLMTAERDVSRKISLTDFLQTAKRFLNCNRLVFGRETLEGALLRSVRGNENAAETFSQGR
jgi:hypothetical protein